MNGLNNCNELNPIQRLINANSPSQVWQERCQTELDRLLLCREIIERIKSECTFSNCAISGDIAQGMFINSILKEYDNRLKEINLSSTEIEPSGC